MLPAIPRRLSSGAIMSAPAPASGRPLPLAISLRVMPPMPTISPLEAPTSLVDYEVDVAVPETARVRHSMKAQIKMPNVVVEVRTYEWDEPEAVIYDVPVYHVSR